MWYVVRKQYLLGSVVVLGVEVVVVLSDTEVEVTGTAAVTFDDMLNQSRN